MSQNTRPGGLMALAILNFIFAALGVFSVLVNSLSLILKDKLIAQDSKVEAFVNKISIAELIFGVVLVPLLVFSGVGCMKQKIKLGYLLGNVAAVAWIVRVMMFSQEFNISSSATLLFPILSLVMLNVIFRKDFINP